MDYKRPILCKNIVFLNGKAEYIRTLIKSL